MRTVLYMRCNTRRDGGAATLDATTLELTNVTITNNNAQTGAVSTDAQQRRFRYENTPVHAIDNLAVTLMHATFREVASSLWALPSCAS